MNVEWGVRFYTGNIERVADERAAVLIADGHYGREAVRRVVGDWEPVVKDRDRAPVAVGGGY